MAYQLKAATGRSKALDALWSDVDLTTVDINEIYKSYSKVYLTLTNSFLPDDVYLDMDAARSIIGVYIGTLTIPQWLASLGNASLPTIAQLPRLRPVPAKYGYAWRAGYKIKPVDRTRHPDSDIPVGERNDLLLSKPGVDFQSLWRYCMVTVNGFFHRPGGSPYGLYVADGGRTGRIGNNNHVGIYSFQDVGVLEYYPITPSMIYKTHPDQKFANTAHIRLPFELENKTVMLVLGGYLHVLDGAYKIVGTRSIQIDFNNYALPERLYESLQNINLEPLQLQTSPNNPAQFSVEDMYSDRALVGYMTLPQSFLVVLNTPSIYVRRHQLEKAKLPGRYLTQMPLQRFPMIGALGRAYDYQAIPERGGRCVLATDHTREFWYNFNTRHWKEETSVDPTTLSSYPWDFARAHLLEVGRFG